jgi:hypothetical protein
VTAVFVALFFIGLIAAVRVMLYGVERQRSTSRGEPRSFSVSPAVISVFCVVVGMTGYVLTKLAVSPLAIWLTAGAAGVLTAFAAVRVISRWWVFVPEHDVDDERYVLQGSLADVVADIAESGVGQVALHSDARRQPIPARSLGEHLVPAGTEVVVERIENGVAYVEEWAEVEKRL